DMNLDNGLGDVEAANKGVLLDTFFMEQMLAVSGTDCNIWLVVASRDTLFKSYNIDINGINPVPVLSHRTAGEIGPGDYLGWMVVSTDGNKLALSKGSLVLYDFDITSGTVSSPLILSSFSGEHYGVAFSPDNSKL